MFDLRRVVLFVVLLTCFYNIRGFAKLEDNSKVLDVQIVLKVALPPDAPPVNFTCSSTSFILHPNTTKGWMVPGDRVDACHVIWVHKQTYFAAFLPDYDGGHPKVYWLVKLDGFFHGWDNISWNQMAIWYGQ